MTIKELLEKHGHKNVNNVIDLGFINGWNKNINDLHKSLRPFWIEETYTKQGPASWQQFSVQLKDEEQEYELVWELDSGD
jgi:hypothetical protein